MTFLPIVERELRVAARRRGTYGMRLRIAGFATVAFAACFAASQIAPSYPFGKSLFWGLSGFCLLYCLSAGRLMTADCLSREKREGTLGLLFLTDLKGYDVVLGKLAATSLDGFYGLLAVFPMLAIPLLAGGMTNGELWRMALVLVNTFLFSLAIGLFASALCRDEQAAMGTNFGLLLLLSAVLPAVGGMIFGSHEGRGPFPHPLFYSCPVYSFFQCADVYFKKSPLNFWSSLGVTFDLTVLLVFLACRTAPRAWQDKPVSPRKLKRKGQRRWRWWREGSVEQSLAFRRRVLAVNAYFWLTARPYLKTSYVWTATFLVGCSWAFTTWQVGHLDEATNFGFAFLLNGMLKLWITVEAGHQLAEDKRAGAFELLLSTPLSVANIVRGQWLALRRQFLKPLVVAVVLELSLMVSLHYLRAEDRTEGWCMWLAGILMLLADAVTVGWVAMSAALTEKSHGRATAKTGAFILALPWILFGMVSGGTRLWVYLFFRTPWEPGWSYDLWWWFCLGIVGDLFFLLKARRRLQMSFRQFALEAPAPKTRLAWLAGALKRTPDGKMNFRRKLRFASIVAAIILAAGAGVALSIRSAFHVDLPKPILVSINHSNQSMKVFGGQNGFLFILPDGSLWRWIHPGWGRGTWQDTIVSQPIQVGTNCDWVQVSAEQTNAIGLRSDGTLWNWSVETSEPKQVGLDHDWAEGHASYSYALARKQDGTLWSWGDNTYDQLGNGPGPSHRDLRQVGTNRDWRAVRTINLGVLAVRSDGTLWSWGLFASFARGAWAQATNVFPTQICSESNWVDFGGAGNFLRNQAGESWSLFPFNAAPGSNVSISAIGRLISTNSAPLAFGPRFTTNWDYRKYQIGADGTLWTVPFSWPPATVPWVPPLRFGERSDWISIWGNYLTMIGLTSDGTVWIWGLDSGQEKHLDFTDRLDVVKHRFSELIGSPPPPPGTPSIHDEFGDYQAQKEPRPLFRLVGGKPR